MINVTYAVIEEAYTLGSDTRISYGIVAYSDAEQNSTATVVASVHDITPDKEMLLKFVENCNRLKLSTVHLYDVIEDFLA